MAHRLTVACCTGVLVLLAGCSTAGRDTSARAPVAAGTALAAWLRQAVPSTAQVTVADVATRDALARSGVDTVVRAPGADPVPAGSVRYAVSADAPTTPARAVTPEIAAVPVATFDGSDGDPGWTVERLVPGPVADVTAALTLDASRRVAAGVALLTNPAVTVCAACRAVFAAGGLDLRAASLLAVLATTGAVSVEQVVTDPAESRAARPARSIVVGGAAPGAIRAIAAATAGSYRPAITAVTTSSTTVTWDLDPSTTTTTGVRP